jgi:hypothetical protein
MFNEYGALGEIKLAGETEVLGENLPQSHSVHTNPTVSRFLKARYLPSP